jgi:hypothetical protein
MQFNRLMISLAALFALAGCGSRQAQEPERQPAEVKRQIVRLLPVKTTDREGWATDIYVAFAAQQIPPSTQNICAVLAVTEQESTFQADPTVPGLGKIARDEIDRRAAKVHIPSLLVSGALQVRSSNGKSYSDRLNAARSEKELSDIFDDFIGMVPLGKTLFGGFNPVHTGGPMRNVFRHRAFAGLPGELHRAAVSFRGFQCRVVRQSQRGVPACGESGIRHYPGAGRRFDRA